MEVSVQKSNDDDDSTVTGTRTKTIQQSSAAGRSVVDYPTAGELRLALESCTVSAGHACDEPPPDKSDWILPVPDPDAEPQTVHDEMQRLLTLKSYLLLDAPKEEAFDRLTREACQLFNVPTSLISLVDLGRQFLLSNTGADVRETSRTSAFCSHTILSKRGICIVPDTTKDPRFQNNSMVTGGPKLRFYAAAPLTSPEGYKIGTFCVEGPEPRPQGLTVTEQAKLRELADKAMKLMVERRKHMQRAYQSANLPANHHLRRHAAVTTNLGSLVYKYYPSECVTAMSLFQESVQTLMHVEDEIVKNCPMVVESTSSVRLSSEERQSHMSKLFDRFDQAQTSTERDRIIKILRDMYVTPPPNARTGANHHMVHSIPGLFCPATKMKRAQSHLNPTQGLFFNEAFDVHMKPSKAFDPKDPHSNLDDRSFIIPLEQCPKATLFNMGLIHYYWGSADSAMQFFDLAASLSQYSDATHFDPVILGCLNNMAQIYLQYSRSSDAMELLSDALTRGNAALNTIYASSGSDDASVSSQDEPSTIQQHPVRREQDIRRTRRLRRKLARTCLNIGHVHFFRCEYDAAYRTCNDALMLLHTNLEEIEVAAAWYNMALIQYHKGHKLNALEKLNKFLDLIGSHLAPGPHAQLSDALQRKGKILFDMGNLYESMAPLKDALAMRKSLFGENHLSVAETLCLVGKVLQEREEYDFALNALEQGLAIQRKLLADIPAAAGDDQLLSFEVAQTLLEVGRAYHTKGQLEKSLEAYLEADELTRKVFGPRHTFVARIGNIVGNLYLEMGDTSKSLEHFQDAMKIHLEQGLSIEMAVVQDPLLKVNLKPYPGAQAA